MGLSWSKWLGVLLGSAASAGLLTAPAVAQPAGDPDWLADWSGYVDVRAAIANGETSWLKGGYGKSRYGGDQAGDAVGRIEVAEAAAIWRPRFSQNFGAVVHLQYEPGQDHAIDLIESYLSMKTDPDSLLRASGKIGVFYPQISLEHDDYGWSTYHTITPSAINTWIGEEIKVAGVEGTVRQELGPGDLSFTASAFEGDDTAGTLMAFRGWALHDQEATVFGSFPLPEKLPRRMSFFNFQDSYSKSMLEVDDRVGFYGQLRYDGPDGSSLSVFHYDNAGNRLAIDGKQWGWATSFTNFGASLSPTPSIQVLSQYLTGETKSGWGDPIPIYAEFSSYYVLGAWDLGAFEIAGRYDNFQVDDRTFVALDNENESGSAVTVAITRMLAEHLLGRMELMRIDSDRPQRADAGLDPKDQQTVFQSSLKYEF